MICFSLGIPGKFSTWCARLLFQVMERSAPTVTSMVTTGAVDTAALMLIRSNVSHLVMSVDEPDAELLALLIETGAPFLLALDDPRTVIADYWTQGHTNVTSATRCTANLCPMLLNCRLLPGVLVLTAQEVLANSTDAVLKLARHFGVALSPEEAGAILSLLDREGHVAHSGNGIDTIPTVARRMVEGALASYAAAFTGAVLGEIMWTRELFAAANDPSGYPQGPIGLRDTHNGRCLIYGPYIRLPAGTWIARVFIGFSSEAIGQTIYLDAYCKSSGQLALSKLNLARGDGLVGELHFSLSEGKTDPIEIRIMVSRDSAPGQLTFSHAVLHPSILGSANKWQGDEFPAVLNSRSSSSGATR